MIIGVVSLDLNRGIGYQGNLLVRLKADMDWFRRLTTERPFGSPFPAVVMGRKTWDSLPPKYRPLPGRKNYVLTRTTLSPEDDVVTSSDWPRLLNQIERDQEKSPRIFIIGGGEIFKLTLPDIEILYITEFKTIFPADTFFPPFEEDFPQREVLDSGKENGVKYEIIEYRRNFN